MGHIRYQPRLFFDPPHEETLNTLETNVRPKVLIGSDK